MIFIDDHTPRWIRELERFVHVKSLLLVHGNILDLVSFPVSRSDGSGIYWTEGELSGFFNRFLAGLGYEIVGSFDPVAGLCFADDSMSDCYRALTGTGDTGATGRERSAGRSRNDDNGLIDANTVMDGISKAVNNRETPCAFVFHFSSRLLCYNHCILF